MRAPAPPSCGDCAFTAALWGLLIFFSDHLSASLPFVQGKCCLSNLLYWFSYFSFSQKEQKASVSNPLMILRARQNVGGQKWPHFFFLTFCSTLQFVFLLKGKFCTFFPLTNCIRWVCKVFVLYQPAVTHASIYLQCITEQTLGHCSCECCNCDPLVCLTEELTLWKFFRLVWPVSAWFPLSIATLSPELRTGQWFWLINYTHWHWTGVSFNKFCLWLRGLLRQLPRCS